MDNSTAKRAQREALISELRELLGDRLSTSPSVLEQHGRGESWHPVQAPDGI